MEQHRLQKDEQSFLPPALRRSISLLGSQLMESQTLAAPSVRTLSLPLLVAAVSQQLAVRLEKQGALGWRPGLRLPLAERLAPSLQ